MSSTTFAIVTILLLCFHPATILAVAAGGLSGSTKDSSGASVANARLVLTDVDQKTALKATSDAKGFYSFPAVPGGHYDLLIACPGFATQEKKNLTVDTDAALRIDVVLNVGHRQEVVTITAAQEAIDAQPDTVATQLGEVVPNAQIEAVPLNGRSTRIC